MSNPVDRKDQQVNLPIVEQNGLSNKFCFEDPQLTTYIYGDVKNLFHVAYKLSDNRTYTVN